MPSLLHHPNRLIHEKSPYLQQHAHNPVDWHPWSEEAFALARAEDRPVLLSIGYATCHWCHVMASESFGDPGVADIMNRHFVCIKVDREERPDIDKIYMTAVTALNGSGGWPLNVFLTPELNPFFGGTYFPPEPRGGFMPSWTQVLRQVAEAWADTDHRSNIRSSADNLTRHLKDRIATGIQGDVEPGADHLNEAIDHWEKAFDSEWGGFGKAPKFPSPPALVLLLTCGRAAHGVIDSHRRETASSMALFTLERMAEGGIFDQLGGGFHRYSTDNRWQVPHFEKMLYDNAQLIPVYLLAFELTGDPCFAHTARASADYVIRDLTLPEGGIASAEDADSSPPSAAGPDPGTKKEGAFFLWAKGDILAIAGRTAGEGFCLRYGIQDDGNLETDPHGDFMGLNIPYRAMTSADVAKALGRSPEAAGPLLRRAERALFAHRETRPRPDLDDKVITSWNGLMLSALARSRQVLGDQRFLDSARRAASFIRRHLYIEETRFLFRRWRDGEAKVPGTAEDYFFMAQGLIDIYETDFDPAWLTWAVDLVEEANRQFHDPEFGGFFMTRTDHDPHMIFRVKDEMDLVMPSAGSVAALTMLRLSRILGRRDFDAQAADVIRSGISRFVAHPEAVAAHFNAWLFSQSTPVQIVIAGNLQDEQTRRLLAVSRRSGIPGKTILVVQDGDRAILTPHTAHARSAVPVDGRPAAYVRTGGCCTRPITDPGDLESLLAGCQEKGD
ncbi:MAG: thioredoxin domain-containing protein [Desulfobacterales bacterium]|jgi:hypothetical protein